MLFFIQSFSRNRTKVQKNSLPYNTAFSRLEAYFIPQSIAFKYCNISALKVLQYHMQY